MTTPTFKTGQIVYDKRGNSAIYESAVEDGHIVFPQFEMGWGDDPVTLEKTVWRDVYAKYPSPSFKGWSWAIAVVIVVCFWGYVFS